MDNYIHQPREGESWNAHQGKGAVYAAVPWASLLGYEWIQVEESLKVARLRGPRIPESFRIHNTVLTFVESDRCAQRTACNLRRMDHRSMRVTGAPLSWVFAEAPAH